MPIADQLLFGLLWIIGILALVLALAGNPPRNPGSGYQPHKPREGAKPSAPPHKGSGGSKPKRN